MEALLEHYGYLFLARNAIFTIVDKRHILLDPRYDIGSIAEYEPALHAALEAYGRYFGVQPPPPAGSTIDAWIDYFAPMATDLRGKHLKGDASLKDCLRVLRGDKTGFCVYDLLVSHRAAAALLSLAGRFIARLDEEKRKRGVLDRDLLICTRTLLDNSSALDRIRRQFDYIFVGEFRNRSRAGRDLRATRPRRIGRVRAEPHDRRRRSKQSIYRFRRADRSVSTVHGVAREADTSRISIGHAAARAC
jgi:hypothetical protein